METFVYEDSPLASYLEGEGAAADDEDTLTIKPIREPDFHEQHEQGLAQASDSDGLTPIASHGGLPEPMTFAPSGRINVRDRIMSKMSAPVHLRPFVQYPSLTAIWEACRTSLTVTLGNDANKRFLDQLGYTIVASQLLNEQSASAYAHPAASSVASVLVGNSQSFDSAASAALAVIQEVELVSRGYRLSNPLPPVTRLEEQSPVKHCLRLRRLLARCQSQLLDQYLDFTEKLTPLCTRMDLEKYHDIYDFSPQVLHEAESVMAVEGDDLTSIRALKGLSARLYAARKGLLCCLLALPATGTAQDIPIWSLAADELQILAEGTSSCLTTMTDLLEEQAGEMPVASPLPSAPVDPTKARNRAQLRKLNSLSQGIRGIHAKMNLIREECELSLDRMGIHDGSGGQQDRDQDADPTYPATLMTMYDSIGTDLRSLTQEWEAGKTALQAAFGPSSLSSSPTSEHFRRSSYSSRPPSGKWLPGSPASTLSGTTAIDTSTNGFLISASSTTNHSTHNSIDKHLLAGPDNALRILTSDNEPVVSQKHFEDDEEVFEAIAAPITVSRKRHSMSREERIARMKEERARHALARERQDTNTHMLRELETVIKLKPRHQARSASQ
ncbi:hypothetical protein KEM52_003283 [Ascosphaera acerosa]|nr:hypothetical protein KEM52_003283 [Ascosphaera acerosa]